MQTPFTYNLPPERIAQRPIQPQDAAKCLVVSRGNGTISETTFRDFSALLTPNDLIIFNDTKVMPVRLIGKRRSGGEAEVFLLKQLGEDTWQAIGKPMKRMREGTTVEITPFLSIHVVSRTGDMLVVKVISQYSPREAIARAGLMPIPPYIRGGRSDASDTIDYQPILAKIDGSVASPTASLHFTQEVLHSILQRGASYKTITLHVGAASFLPVVDEQGKVRPPGFESFSKPATIIDEITAARRSGGRVFAVGTTTVRCLESDHGEGETNLFIQPGYHCKSVDAVITNFHQPGTTHLLLVEALLGRDLLEKVYTYALENNFRFLSYGDGMVILP